MLFIFTYLHALIKQLETALNYFCIQYQFILLHYTACTVHTYCSTMFILLFYSLVKISVVYKNLLSIVCACMDMQLGTDSYPMARHTVKVYFLRPFIIAEPISI